ncbi:DUF262 domain-containing protein [Gluconacetobacter aggeris]|uniref:DUF262 domain-containing protein n=1 Tax=Gluconacetobacter aggeris TaxID=1286186 RepID=A0A7W4NXD9_9PROT|nr:DUF262 domain-containing protein [Gluconacetobacter aggeris]MBB2169647.1 DUF262 domain-containing protein [Gluconacetobacter aggeris]
MEDLSIREILEQVGRGQIRIPAFQRGFVWDSDRVAYLMDSIYKKYPFGALLFWRTKNVLKYDRKLGPFVLPDPKEDYPVDYVLDGQQRITSIFGVFQTEIERPDDPNWLPIFYDLEAEQTVQDSQFVALKPEAVDPARHFPMSTLFSTAEYRAATTNFDDSTIERIDQMQAIFKEVKIPLQLSRTEDKATVAIIFERVNRQGVELDTLQLLSAWTWSEDFQLNEEFSDLADELQPFGFQEIGVDTNLLLRCCSAILKHDASPQALMELKGATVRENFDQVTNGVKYAVDYIRRHFHAEKLSNLPFSTLLVPLSVLFAVSGNKEASTTDEQRERVNSWFWRASLSRRYSSAVLRNLNTDISEMVNLRDGKPSKLGDFSFHIDAEFFTRNTFGMANVNTKTFILMLAGLKPLSFISGSPVDLAKTLKESNRTEFHHMMPRAYLRESSQTQKYDDSCLANFCFLSRTDNRKIGGDKPSVYRSKMPTDITAIQTSAMFDDLLFKDDYEKFIAARADALVDYAMKLACINKTVAAVPVAPVVSPDTGNPFVAAPDGISQEILPKDDI